MISERSDTAPASPRPLGLLAELTYRCPLHCPYCSNPVDYPAGEELTLAEWARTFGEASELGVLHALFSGGEPLARPDLAQLVAAARQAGLYVNLLTSALGLTASRAEELKQAGLDSVQISLQGNEEASADAIAGATAHVSKLKAARLVRSLGLPLTINVVLHRDNIDAVEAIIDLALGLDAHRLELANVQFYGWAFRNRSLLLPSEAQVERAGRIAADARARYTNRMEILSVLPDYFGERPKPCMGGWGRRYLTVNPVGDVLPCPNASEIAGLEFDNVRRRPLASIWSESDAFCRFRGTAWMPEPCRSCDLREVDFGGCRCQAALLTDDPANTDPACGLSPHHEIVVRLRDRGGTTDVTGQPTTLIYRQNPSRMSV